MSKPVAAGDGGIAFVFLRKRDDIVGGLPTAVESLRLDAKGNWQRTRADLDNNLHGMAQGSGKGELWNSLAGDLARGLPPVLAVPPSNPVEEFHPARVSIAVGFASGTCLKGEWPAASLPASIRATWNALDAALDPPQPVEDEAFLRADKLLPNELAGLPSPVALPELVSSIVTRAIETPFHIQPVPVDVNPLDGLRSRFTPGRDVLEVRKGEAVFQLRSFRSPKR